MQQFLDGALALILPLRSLCLLSLAQKYKRLRIQTLEWCQRSTTAATEVMFVVCCPRDFAVSERLRWCMQFWYTAEHAAHDAIRS